MTPARFAQGLVERLVPLVPEGIVVRAAGDHVHVFLPDGPGTSASVGHLDPAEAEDEDYADAAWNVLSMVQDAVSEQTDEPWPGAAGPSGDLPEPGTRVEAGAVHLWFGDEEQPVCVLPPLPLN